MKLLIASDIHGSEKYAQIIKDAFIKNECDTLLLLGDLLYHGPRNDLPENYAPKKVIEILNSLKDKIIAVRGNCEAEVDQMVLNFPVLADYAILTVGKKMIFVTHGHVFNNSNLPPIKPGDILLHGHTHVPVCEEYETHIYMNPGSVSIPKENSPHSYMIFDGKCFEWKTLEGEVYKQYVLK